MDDFTPEQMRRINQARAQLLEIRALSQVQMDAINALVETRLSIQREQIETELVAALEEKPWTPQWGRSDWKHWLQEQFGPVKGPTPSEAIDQILAMLDAPLANGVSGYRIEGWHGLAKRTRTRLLELRGLLDE